MTDLEQKIIDLIKGNQNLSEDLKQRYILALFLMGTDEQQQYLHLIEAFNYRCNVVERGIFILREDEKQHVMRTLEEVKEDILKKIHSKN